MGAFSSLALVGRTAREPVVDVDALDDEHLVLDDHGAFGLGAQLPLARVDPARLQRATQGAGESTCGRGDDVVEGRGVVGILPRLGAVVFAHLVVGPEPDGLGLRRQVSPADRPALADDPHPRDVLGLVHRRPDYDQRLGGHGVPRGVRLVPVMDPVPSTQAVGQISADGQFRWDGQQWVPLARGYREPTPWTRPMQLASAGLFGIAAVVTVLTTVIFVNHDSMLRAIHAQGTQIPARTDIDTVVNVAIAFAYGVAIFIALIEAVVAVGSYLGWRWMFWAALVLNGLTGIYSLINIPALFVSDRSAVPLGGLVFGELLDLLALALFVWMLVGVIKYGPWAMRRPGR